jgi:hypothetical protein
MKGEYLIKKAIDWPFQDLEIMLKKTISFRLYSIRDDNANRG